MQNRLVPRSEWLRFFREFSRRYEGRRVTVRVLHPRLGSQVEARDLPLEGVVAPVGEDGPIALHIGRPPDGNVEHEVGSPRQVWVEMSEPGVEDALGIVSRDGTTTILELNPAAAPAPIEPPGLA